jgi:hypothetical protein
VEEKIGLFTSARIMEESMDNGIRKDFDGRFRPGTKWEE